MVRDDYVDWMSGKDIFSQKQSKLCSNLWQLIRDNYPTQKNEIFFITAKNKECRFNKQILKDIQCLGIKISACVLLCTEDKEADYNGIPCIAEEELINNVNENTRLIVGLYINSEVFNGIIDKYPEHISKMVPIFDILLPQYFEQDILQPDENEIFVDVGVYNFSNSIDFHNWALKGYDKIYAFEPDLNCYNSCLSSQEVADIILSGKVELINKGLSYRSGVLEFPAQYISSGVYENDDKIEVGVVSLDEFLNNRSVTFIKMDVEGAEMDVLLGMKNTIIQCRPKLAVCIYHHLRDLYEIMSYILSLVPEYRCYIRHYSTASIETVLFCVI